MSAATAASSIQSHVRPNLDQTTTRFIPKMQPLANGSAGTSHRFLAHTYTVPKFCHHCHELMQEPSGHGLQCQNCRCNVHTHCAAKLVGEVCLANQGTAREVHSYDEVNEDELSALEQEAARSETRGSVSGTNSVGSWSGIDSGSQWSSSKKGQSNEGQSSAATAVCGCGAPRLSTNPRCLKCQQTTQSKHSSKKAASHSESLNDALLTPPVPGPAESQQENLIGSNSVHAYSNLPNFATLNQSSEEMNAPYQYSLVTSPVADNDTTANHMRAHNADKQAHQLPSHGEPLSQWPAYGGVRKSPQSDLLKSAAQQPMVSPMSWTNLQSASVYANSEPVRFAMGNIGLSLAEGDGEEELAHDSRPQPLDSHNAMQLRERHTRTQPQKENERENDAHTQREGERALPRAASCRGEIPVHAKMATSAQHFAWRENGAGLRPYWPGVDQFSAWAMAAKINNSGIAFDDLRAMAVLGLDVVDLTQAPFFHAMSASLTQAERRARLEDCFQDKPDGTWLLRMNNGTYVLSVKYNFRVRHVLVEGQDGRFFVVPGVYFKTVLQLLAHYVHCQLSATVPVQLRFPLVRHGSLLYSPLASLEK